MAIKVTTPEFRASYVHVFHPKKNENGEDRYSISMIFSKSTDITELKRAALKVAKETWGPDVVKLIKAGRIKLPFRDGDVEREDDEAYEDSIFCNAASNRKPGVVDRKLNYIVDPEDFNSGDYARATINFFTFDRSGNKGVGVGLLNIQKLKSGERLGGGVSADRDFDAVDGGEDDFDDDDILGAGDDIPF